MVSILNHDKGPWRITFETNPDTCNLHCMMCEVHSRFNQNKSQRGTLPFSIIEQVVNSALPYGLKEIIPSTMGEPLLFKEFERLIELAKRSSIKINLTTNGTFPGKGVDNWAKIILPVASDTKISMNGASAATAERIMQGLNYDRQVKNLKKYLEVRDEIRASGANYPTVTVQTTFMESNIQELPELLEIAIDMGVDRFKGHHLCVTWPQVENESIRNGRKKITEWNNTVERLYAIAENNRLPSGKKIKLANIFPLSIDETESNSVDKIMICPFLGKEAWISWDGRFDVCCAPDVNRRKLGEYGNVKDKDIMDIWQSKPYDLLIKEWGTYEVCKECNMKIPVGRC